MSDNREDWGVRLSAARVEAMRTSGAWHDRILTDFFDQHAVDRPEETAIVAVSQETSDTVVMSYGELAIAADRMAIGMYELGVRRGDIVSFQLPNCWEFIALVLACIRIGAITHPVMPILRHRELTFMLRLTGSRLLITPESFRGFDFAKMARDVAAAVPTLEHVFAVGDRRSSFARYFLAESRDSQLGAIDSERPDANDLMQLIFTSGTTGEPKGVMHTANTMFANVIPFAARMGLNSGDVGYCPTPIAHQLGYLFGVLTPLMLGGKVVLQDIWDPRMAARLIEEHRVTYCMGATPFLNDLANYEPIEQCDTASLRYFISGGAPIPSALVRTAKARIGCQVISVWGMTEVSAVTTVLPNDADEKVFETDGIAMPHCEVCVVDESGAEMPRGQSGRLLTRGASQFVGYFKRPELYATDHDGWFDTGDVARMDVDGYIRITGRTKDIIIRGGENIPVVEIEALLYQHPAIRMVAIVGMPDPRLGERACAFVELKPGQSVTFDEIRGFLRGRDVAPSYLPERLEVVDSIPLTPTGKIQKYLLRETVRTLAAES